MFGFSWFLVGRRVSEIVSARGAVVKEIFDVVSSRVQSDQRISAKTQRHQAETGEDLAGADKKRYRNFNQAVP